MSQYFSKDEILQNQEWSYDLKQYVVPVKILKQMHGIDCATAKETAELKRENSKMKDNMRVLFNRCATLSRGALCFFCGLSKECDDKRSVMRGDSMKPLREKAENEIRDLCKEE